MKLSQYYIPTLREAPRDAENVSAQLMMRSGMVRKVASGLYSFLPLGMRVLKNVEEIIREEMNGIGALEVWLPHIQPKELWEETGRWGVYGKELLRIKDRKNSEFCFAPTAEEVITDLVRKDVKSYRQLPITLYQFGAKFRDEIRPRFGVMRAREFYMKDAYSFHADETDASNYYEKAFEAYGKIFKKCGLKFWPVQAESGAIGGSFSHEFMVLAETGEDEIVSCSNGCGYAANRERAAVEYGREVKSEDLCLRCKEKGKESPLRFSRGIEVGHTFKLGAKYSQAMQATYLDDAGKSHPFVMGCYGIGVSRVVAAAIEQSYDANGIIWPREIAPFQVILVPINFEEPKTKEWSLEIERELTQRGVSVLLDDRSERAGVKFKDADLIGAPIRVTIGEKGIQNGTVEVKERAGETVIHVRKEEILTHLIERI